MILHESEKKHGLRIPKNDLERFFKSGFQRLDDSLPPNF